MYILFSVLIASAAIGNLSSVAGDIAKEKAEAELMERLDFNQLIEMDTDGDGIDQNEYVIGMLLLFEDVDQERIDMLKEQFAEHDKDGSGKLDRTDLAMIAREKDLEKAKRQLVLKGLKGDALAKEFEKAKAEIEKRSGAAPTSPKSGDAAKDVELAQPTAPLALPTDGPEIVIENNDKGDCGPTDGCF